MVSQLLSPTQPKNLSDLLVVATLGLHILALYALPQSLRRPVFAMVYLLWRAAYNAGIGYLLHIQSNHKRLVMWAKKWRLFTNPDKELNPRPWLYKFTKRELETKIPKDYRFEDAPIEYNTWLIFRRIVDLILMCDFVSYCLFAVACGGRPEHELAFVTTCRWAIGLGLVGFNLWVKLDAHRVVKDYAWYWGDFFYLVDQELTFDGVFEMAPHPMYSVGYAGYYGISLMAASYKVLFISIVAHAAQFAFLVWVENPHIEKTYNALPSRKQPHSESDIQVPEDHHPGGPSDSPVPSLASTSQPSPVHNLLGFSNIDCYRVTDTSVILLQAYLFTLTIITPDDTFYQLLFVLNAFVWRLWYSIGVGYVLNRQSVKKKWTRHFLKFGESTEEAWRQWKGMYHLTMSMTYASFIAASWKLYTPPADWSQDMALLKHVMGAALVSLHVWTSVSIYQSLGEFGWFYGDFFFDHASKLTYGGIHRFLNNPERVLGLAGLWAAVLFTGSSAIFATALSSHVLSLAFIQFVERPHMQKLYGQSLRRDSGLVKSLKRSLPPALRQWQGSMDKMFGETVDFVEEFVDAARPKIAAGVSILVKDSTSLFKQPARISITRLEPDLAGYDPKDYSLEVVTSANGTPNSFHYGSSIRVKWTAPLNHSKRDWVGLYRAADNASREATRVSSAGRWVPTNREQYESLTADRGNVSYDERVSGSTRKDGESQDFMSGIAEFSGDKLWWTTGVFEFRYHHNGKHNVMAISRPFEIRIDKFDEEDVEVDSNGLIKGAVEEALLPLVRDCFDRNPDIAPSTVWESYGKLVERDGKYSKRVVYAVTQM